MDESERHATGMKVRRAVLGDEHVTTPKQRKTPSPSRFRI